MADASQDTACLNGKLGSPAVHPVQSEAIFPRTGTPQAPDLGAEVSFQRSPTHHWECGFVKGRQFGTGIIDILDTDAKPLRLMPEQYRAVAP